MSIKKVSLEQLKKECKKLKIKTSKVYRQKYKKIDC